MSFYEIGYDLNNISDISFFLKNISIVAGLFSFRIFVQYDSLTLNFVMGLSSYLAEPGFSGWTDFQDYGFGTPKFLFPV